MNFLSYLFGFEGRINRAKLWLAGLIILSWMIFLAVLTYAASIIVGHQGSLTIKLNIDDIFGIFDPSSFHPQSFADLPVLLLRLIGTPLFVWIYLATSVKRLHDRNRSGWWMALFFVVPGLYSQFEGRLGDSIFVSLLGYAAFGLTTFGCITMYFLKGNAGSNRFGPDPLEPIETNPGWDQTSELQFVPHSAGPPHGLHVKRRP